ncbi:helix-turn-helix domain-containing protein, partial [Streptomyces fradiae]|uniref:helix-turn-helix domain-containing protein n=1 Tax=Streptomyces fradiae TaxID=1906 RepID=UPI00343236BE
MSAAETGGAQVKSAVRTVELLEFFAGSPGMHTLAAVQEAVGYPRRAGRACRRSPARSSRWCR